MATGPRRLELAARAADLYEAAADRHGGSFSCINAATLRVIAGDTDAARVLAEQARDIIETGPAADRNSYWQLATLAEVALVLDDLDAARPALERAAQAAGDDVAARAVTRRQLQVLCAAQGIDASILDVLAPSTVLHYCGHRLDEHDAITRFPAALESRVAAQIAQYLDDRSVGFAYGSLASGADTLVAEAVLDRGIELHVVLPFDADDFETTSVASAGRAWSARYRACLARATSVSCASDSAYLGDSELFGYNSRIAMGHTIKRGSFPRGGGRTTRNLGRSPGRAGRWDRARRRGVATRRTCDARYSARHRAPARDRSHRARPGRGALGVRHSLRRLPWFQPLARRTVRRVHRACARRAPRVLKRYGDAIEYRNSWGDAIKLIVRDVQSAAVCALELQEAVEAIDLAAIGLPADLALRIGGHAGPVVAIPTPSGTASRRIGDASSPGRRASSRTLRSETSTSPTRSQRCSRSNPIAVRRPSTSGASRPPRSSRRSRCTGCAARRHRRLRCQRAVSPR